MVFFFFKQKTAYEMRISDWSSDVCSSDLCGAPQVGIVMGHPAARAIHASRGAFARDGKVAHHFHQGGHAFAERGRFGGPIVHLGVDVDRIFGAPGRSEEHTSELQSLMRISYAVFCLKKKKYHKKPQYTNYHTK